MIPLLWFLNYFHSTTPACSKEHKGISAFFLHAFGCMIPACSVSVSLYVSLIACLAYRHIGNQTRYAVTWQLACRAQLSVSFSLHFIKISWPWQEIIGKDYAVSVQSYLGNCRNGNIILSFFLFFSSASCFSVIGNWIISSPPSLSSAPNLIILAFPTTIFPLVANA